MDFEYTDYVTIESADLRKMYKRVKAGENFDYVFDTIMSSYVDYNYYACNCIREDVRKEINRRLNQSLT